MVAVAGPAARVAVFISGRGSNLGALLAAESGGGLGPASIVLVASSRPGAAGLEVAKAAGVRAEVLPREGWAAAARGLLAEVGADLLCLAGFMRILPPDIIAAMAGQVVNIHPSLLPAFPGLDVHERVLAAGMEASGCTVHWVDEGVDTGPVIAQRAVAVMPDDDPETLAARVLAQEHLLYPEVVRAVATGRLAPPGRG
ncbi:phosphoribosylglycinamide formyltransferase [bacterium]|nr:phosphoribosylglycinamide formyltransferase [bacterium]